MGNSWIILGRTLGSPTSEGLSRHQDWGNAKSALLPALGNKGHKGMMVRLDEFWLNIPPVNSWIGTCTCRHQQDQGEDAQTCWNTILASDSAIFIILKSNAGNEGRDASTKTRVLETTENFLLVVKHSQTWSKSPRETLHTVPFLTGNSVASLQVFISKPFSEPPHAIGYWWQNFTADAWRITIKIDEWKKWRFLK